MGNPDNGLVAKVDFTLASAACALKLLFCRKIFGDGGKSTSNQTGRRLQITTKTAYKMMRKQKQQEADEGGAQEGWVCTKRFSCIPDHALMVDHNSGGWSQLHIPKVDPTHCSACSRWTRPGEHFRLAYGGI